MGEREDEDGWGVVGYVSKLDFMGVKALSVRFS